MLSQYFAQYLLNNNYLTVEQVKDLLEDEKKSRVKVGILAINKGLMTAEEVKRVHQLQCSVDKKFGEVAIDAGYLTVEQLTDLLNTQDSENLNFGQAAIDKDYITLEQLEEALNNYKDDNHLAIKETIGSYADINFAQIGEAKEVYFEYVELFLRAVVRFLDTNHLITSQKQDGSKNTWMVKQTLVGDVSLYTAMFLSDEVLIEMARRYSGEDITTVDELALDSVAEFLNVDNGLFAVNLSDRGIEIDLQPQETCQAIDAKSEKHWLINIDTTFGVIQVAVGAEEIS